MPNKSSEYSLSREIDSYDIKVNWWFYKSSYKTKKARFMVSYLLNQFYLQLTNKRTDKYNGNSI